MVINCGSSTVKADVFALRDREPEFVAKALADRVGKGDARVTVKTVAGEVTEADIPGAGVSDAIDKLMEMFAIAGVCSATDLVAIGHRVVHGGAKFTQPVVINDEVIAAVREMAVFAPLHNPANLTGIECCAAKFAARQVAVFDTAFHQTMPAVATTYAIPHELSEKHALRRYGFHGTSHEYVTRECARRMAIPYGEFHAISLHLGNGASACAVQEGKSVDTSMGFTPLEGLVMGTRSGDIDPSLPFFLQRHAGLSAQDAESLLNKQSGLQGLAGAGDMRELLVRAANGDQAAELAVDIFCSRVRKYIGAYLTWGEPHAVIFTGGIGENSAEIRHRILRNLEHLGITISVGKNQKLPDGGCISAGSTISAYVINTDEELMIARAVVSLLSDA